MVYVERRLISIRAERFQSVYRAVCHQRIYVRIHRDSVRAWLLEARELQRERGRERIPVRRRRGGGRTMVDMSLLRLVKLDRPVGVEIPSSGVVSDSRSLSAGSAGGQLGGLMVYQKRPKCPVRPVLPPNLGIESCQEVV